MANPCLYLLCWINEQPFLSPFSLPRRDINAPRAPHKVGNSTYNKGPICTVSTSKKNTVGQIPLLRSPNILLLLTREKPAPVLMAFGLGSYSWEKGEKGERQSLKCRTQVMAQFVPELVHGAPDRKTNNSQRRLSLPHTHTKKEISFEFKKRIASLPHMLSIPFKTPIERKKMIQFRISIQLESISYILFSLHTCVKIDAFIHSFFLLRLSAKGGGRRKRQCGRQTFLLFSCSTHFNFPFLFRRPTLRA